MKKIISLLATLAVICGCDKEQEKEPAKEQGKGTVDEPGGEQGTVTSLADTHWVAVASVYGVYDEGRRDPIEGEKYELIFTSESEVSLCVIGTYLNRETGEDVLTLGGTYKYDHPEIVFFGAQFDTKHDLSQFGLLDGEYGPPSTIVGDEIMNVQIFTGGDELNVFEFRKQEQP